MRNNTFTNNIFSITDYGGSYSTGSFRNCILNNIFKNDRYYPGYNPYLGMEGYKDFYKGSSINFYDMEGCLIKGNTFLSANKYAIHIHSLFSMIYDNNISTLNNGVGIHIEGHTNYIKNNNIFRNINGIVINDTRNWIITNTIIYNDYGIVVNDFHSHYINSSNISFNRITNNKYFGLYGNSGNINAIDNWWGSNNPSLSSGQSGDIYLSENNNFIIIYKPYLILTVYPFSYKMNNGLIYRSTIVADLNHNNYNLDVSNLGSVPDGINVRFSSDNVFFRNITYSGKSSRDFSLNSDNYKNVQVSVDKETKSTTFTQNAIAHISVSSSAFCENNNPLNFDYDLPLVDNLSWVSLVWKYLSPFKSEVNLLIGGNIVRNYTVESSFYKNNPRNVSDLVLNACALYNDFLYNKISYLKANLYVGLSLKYNLHTLEDVKHKYEIHDWGIFTQQYLDSLLFNHSMTWHDVLLNLIQNSYGLSNSEINFIKEYHDYFQDNISIKINYPGDSAEKFNIDIKNKSKYFSFLPLTVKTESFTFMGNNIARSGKINYVNGAYSYVDGYDYSEYKKLWNTHEPNGTITFVKGYEFGHYAEAEYDGFLTFTFANTKVDNNILSYWLNQKNRTDSNNCLVYNEGFMKACYGSFLNGLLTIYCNDLVADMAASKFNVSWTRTSPMVMGVRDDYAYTFLSGECGFSMGRTVVGSPNNIKAFNFACSASFSQIEHWVMHALFPNWGNNSGVTVGLASILMNNGSIEIVQDGRYTFIRELGSNAKILIYDSETGFIRDLINFDLSGSYCYSNQQTEWGWDFGNELLINQNLINSFIQGNNINISSLSSAMESFLESIKYSLGVAGILVKVSPGYLSTSIEILEFNALMDLFEPAMGVLLIFEIMSPSLAKYSDLFELSNLAKFYRLSFEDKLHAWYQYYFQGSGPLMLAINDFNQGFESKNSEKINQNQK